jgi:hypothetical protein
MKSPLFIILAFTVYALQISTASMKVIPSEMTSAVEAIEQIHALREGLANSLDSNSVATQETFSKVCKPVGQQAELLSNKNPWKLRQVSDKYRNPKHKANDDEMIAIQKFKNNPEMLSLFSESKEGVYYFRRITVQAKCLSCHGDADKRPEFIKKNFPQDLAFNFKVGDLRGLYSVYFKKQ